MPLEDKMINIQIDGKDYEVTEGRNLLATCLALGFDLPYFCYHPAMGSVGACRQCAVKKFKDAADTKGKIIMSCMEPVTKGMIISIDDPEAKAFRTSVIESLMLNHPHDCPVCDEGGECHLQDMTVMTGHNYRRNDFPKRTFKNQYLGPFINHEMNRCIECYRCVRFYKEYAGGKDFDVFGSHDHVYFGRYEEGILESEFSGNLAEVCPTGVFTDKTLREHYTRKWDLTNSPSICVNCSVGCNIIAGERYGSLRRIMSRYNGSVNGYFICDRGRFGYDFVNSDQRIKKAFFRNETDSTSGETDSEKVMHAMTRIFAENKKTIGIGSPRASLEANYCLNELVGEDHFYHGVPEKEHAFLRRTIEILRQPGIHSPSLQEIGKADAVLILGEDVTATAPMMALAIRQASRTVPVREAVKSGIPEWQDDAIRNAIQNRKSPIFIAHHEPTKLDELARDIYRGDITTLGTAVVAALKGKVTDGNTELSEISATIATSLQNAESPLIVTGVTSPDMGILNAAADIASALSASGKKPMLAVIVKECNSIGLGMMEGPSWESLVPAISGNEKFTAIILENDLFKIQNDPSVNEFLSQCHELVVMDHTISATTEKADLLIPVGTFAEAEGTLVSYEGRAQRYYRVLPHGNTPSESWRWLKGMMVLRGNPKASSWQNIQDVIVSMASDIPAFKALTTYEPEQDYLMLNEKINRQTKRFTGRTAITANINVHEPKPPSDPDSPMVFSMEGKQEHPPSDLVPFYWVPGWNSVQSMNFYLDEPNGHMKGGDPGIRLFANLTNDIEGEGKS